MHTRSSTFVGLCAGALFAAAFGLGAAGCKGSSSASSAPPRTAEPEALPQDMMTTTEANNEGETDPRTASQTQTVKPTPPKGGGAVSDTNGNDAAKGTTSGTSSTSGKTAGATSPSNPPSSSGSEPLPPPGSGGAYKPQPPANDQPPSAVGGGPKAETGGAVYGDGNTGNTGTVKAPDTPPGQK